MMFGSNTRFICKKYQGTLLFCTLLDFRKRFFLSRFHKFGVQLYWPIQGLCGVDPNRRSHEHCDVVPDLAYGEHPDERV